MFKDMTYIEEDRVNIQYELPLNEIIYDFFDQLKSRSRGYASFDYELKEYVKSDLVKLDFLLNGDICDALSTIVHRDKAYAKGRAVAEKLQEVIPRQQFEIPIQAAIGGKIICPRNRPRSEQGRACKVLWRRYFPKEKAARKTEGGQEAYAPDRHCFTAQRCFL